MALIKEDNVKKVKKELNKKKNKDLVAEVDRRGKTMLHIAVEQGNLELVKYFIEKQRIEVNATDRNGWTPLHAACYSAHVDVVDYLLNSPSCDCDVNLKAVDQSLPLHYMVRLDPNVLQDQYPIEVIQNLFERKRLEKLHGKPKNMVEEQEMFWQAFLCMMQKLTTGNNVNSQNKNGDTPLHVASCKEGTPVRVIEFLLNNNAEINITNKFGETCLHMAVRADNADLVEFLMEKGVDVNIKGDSGTAKDLFLNSYRELDLDT